MQINTQAQTRLDEICVQRLTSPDFAHKQSLFDKLLHLLKGAAS